MNKPSPTRIVNIVPRPAAAALVVTALTAVTTLARAELVEIKWDSQEQFRHAATLAPGKMLEVCGKLPKGAVVDWAFSGERPTDFNIHYHEGKKVVYPTRQREVSRAAGRLSAALDQHYCWMWELGPGAPTVIELELRR